jgi:hypothetical protein
MYKISLSRMYYFISKQMKLIQLCNSEPFYIYKVFQRNVHDNIVSESEYAESHTGNDSNPEDNRPQIEYQKISYKNKIINGTEIYLQIENGKVNQEKEENNSLFCGESTLTGESTSKSSVEWQSSTITKDSETEYPFSSSSRKSSSRWESYTFRKYDEEMLYFHRISAEKLAETGIADSSFSFF